MIPREDWAKIKSGIKRRKAFNLQAEDRACVRDVLAFAGRLAPNDRPSLNVLPICSMQASSVVKSSHGHRIALIDTEQANALNFLLARHVWLEGPIFAYAEFMVRAAEELFDQGDYPLAISISQRANTRLLEYTNAHGEQADIPRPVGLNPLLLQALEARLTLAFITGHEIGHLAQRLDQSDFERFFATVHDIYQENEYEPMMHIAGGETSRFFKPDSIQKFSDEGVWVGDIVQGTKYIAMLPEITKRLIHEVQSDALGTLCATHRAIQQEIPPPFLIFALKTMFEGAEQYSTISRVLTQLSRGEKRCHITHPHTKVTARYIVLIKFIRALCDGRFEIPPEIKAYWDELPEETLAGLEASIENHAIENTSILSTVLARGAVNISLQGHLGNHPSEEEIMVRWGALAGSGYFLNAHLKFPENVYRIEQSYQVTSEDLPSVHQGFAGALTDLTNLKTTETRAAYALAAAEIERDGTDEKFIAMLRSVRSQIYRRCIDPNWCEGFEPHLR